MQKDKGFTLIEMMVVIAIMAIVSAIAIPNIYSFAAGMKRRAACSDLYSTLQKTRMYAIRQPDSQWKVEFTSSTYVVSGGGKSTITKFSEYPGINISIPAGTVEFYPDGTASKAVSATFTDAKGYSSQVEVFASGRIKSS